MIKLFVWEEICSSTICKAANQMWKNRIERYENKKAYPVGNQTVAGPSNSPAAMIFRFEPKSILQFDNNDTVQKGLRKSWWSIWGGMQSPSSYIFTMQLSGMHLRGKTPHLTILSIICLNNGGKCSTSASLMIPGGFPYLSCKVLWKRT